MSKQQHNHKELLMGEIQQLIDLSDALSVEEQVLHKDAESLMKELVAEVKQENNPTEKVADWRALSARIAMVNEDLTTVLRMLMGYFMAIRSLGWEDSLKPTDKERLNYLVDNNQTMFTTSADGIEPRDNTLYDTAITNIRSRTDFDDGFIERLKSTEFFNSEEQSVEKTE